LVAVFVALAVPRVGSAQRGGQDTLGEGPWVYETYERGMPPVRVSVVTKGLSHPWGMVFLPNGDMLVTERDTRNVRILRNGMLEPDPVPGMPDLDIDKLFDIALDPDFESNRFVYFTYIKSGSRPDGSQMP
jgi:glucose/arabinose dehydrogenase